MLGRERRRGASGFTLVEVLVGVVLLGLIAAAVASISLSGVFRTSDEAQARQADAVAAQQASLVLARDVQGAEGIAGNCSGTPGGRTPLVTLEPSDGSDPIEYQTTDAAPYSLYRVRCTPSGQTGRAILEDLLSEPAILCDGAACVPTTVADPAPRVVSLEVERTATFDFELDGARRLTDGNSTSPPLDVPDFVALGGSMPLSIGGSSTLIVQGNAFINAPDTGTLAVNFNGGAQLQVTGDFRLQTPGVCENSCANANPVPGSYVTALPDPLRFLPNPETSSMTTHNDCPIGVVGGEQRRICQPGIYPSFPPTGGSASVKDYVLEPGVYVLQDGMKVTNGSLEGTGVTFYNQTGEIDIQGGDFNLTAPDSGTYARILLFQARDNDAEIKINGNGSISVLNGTLYAPGSDGVLLGSGSAGLTVGRIIGTSLSTSGSGTVTVVGS
jgi:prepilin-type N-terminal cleavage/methylation domain-containing protein